MNRPFRRAPAVAALALALGVTGAACSSGFDAPVFLVEPHNVDTRVGEVLLRSLVLVKAEGGDSVSFTGAMINGAAQPDTLTRIEITGGATPLSATPNVQLPPRRVVTFGGPEGERVIIRGARNLPLGNFVPVTLTFQNAGVAEVRLLVEDATQFYAPYAPPGAPSPTPTASPGGTPVPGTIESPGATEPTPSPTH